MAEISLARFIDKWGKASVNERAGAQSHFNDLCDLLGHQKPIEVDPQGEWFAFEYGMRKTTGQRGYADVYKKGYFGWEYKGKKKDLNAAYSQLQQYAPALANPPLLIVSDIERFIIHTNWNDFVSETHAIELEDLSDPDKLNLLRYAFFEPEKLKPAKTRQQLTEEIAGKFARISERLRGRGNDAHDVAHFVNRLIFCMFAEDIELLPKRLFTDLFNKGASDPAYIQKRLSKLFNAMNKGGEWGADDIAWFNGGLFDHDRALLLDEEEISLVYQAAQMDWSDIDPSIMGTLFERGLDPKKQSQLGAHYTDRQMIMKIVQPVIIDPMTAEWAEAKDKIYRELAKAESYANKENTSQNAGQKTKAEKRALRVYNGFLSKLRDFKVLDLACGSGNFLYLSLNALKDIEREVTLFGEAAFHLPQHMPEIGPENIYGIEINDYAAELARVSVWIGEIQWIKKHGFNVPANPVLRNLKNIVCCDALMKGDGTEFHWPKTDVVIGNPPFIGDKKMIRELGEDYSFAVRDLYKGRVSGGADFVCYWFAKAYDYMREGRLVRCGLVSTNSIRGGKNREILDRVCTDFQIFDAWPDEEWVNEGAALRVSMTSFSPKSSGKPKIRNKEVKGIRSDLSIQKAATKFDSSKVQKLTENKGVSFIGTQKNGPFTIPYEQAKEWLELPLNPNGRPNSDVIRPWANGQDLTRRPSHTWIIDFDDRSEVEASFYEEPFSHVVENVKPTRVKVRRKNHRENWWVYGENRPAMRRQLKGFDRFIATSMVAKHRFFVWLPVSQIPENLCVVIASESDTVLGILTSKFHVLWSLKLCTWMGKGNDQRYTPSTCFETFPFPDGLNFQKDKDLQFREIVQAARDLDGFRNNWLNPPDLVRVVPPILKNRNYPTRYEPVDEKAAILLKKRTLTNLYNENPTWLQNAHRVLDDAVAAAYGWPTDLSDDEILENLFDLNQRRSADN